MPAGLLRLVLGVDHLGREDGRQLILDVDAELGRKLSDVDAELSSQFPKCLVEYPFLSPKWASEVMSVVDGRRAIKERAAGRSYRSQVRDNVLVLVVVMTELGR